MPRRQRVTCRFRGGFANQLFTLAATLAYAARHDLEPVLSVRQVTGAANPNVAGRNSVVSAYARVPRSRKRVHYDAVTFRDRWALHEWQAIPAPPEGRDVVLDGLYGHSDYFTEHRQPIVELFRPPPGEIARLEAEFASVLDGETVSVSFRRGDYLKQGVLRRFDEDQEYYTRALTQLPSSARIRVFSDDLDWCRANVDLGRPTEFVTSGSVTGDLYLIGRCTHHVIANSTYHWWAAWLDTAGSGLTVQPERWYSEDYVERLGRDLRSHDPGGWVSV